MPAFDPNRVKHHPLPAWTSHSFHAHAVDLSVDSITGEVSINRYVVAQDVGYAINPTYIEGQIEGGVAQGIGQTLSEEIVYEDGRVLNANLTDYKMPTMMDMPRVECILIESRASTGRMAPRESASHPASSRRRRSPMPSPWPRAFVCSRCRSRRRRSHCA